MNRIKLTVSYRVFVGELQKTIMRWMITGLGPASLASAVQYSIVVYVHIYMYRGEVVSRKDHYQTFTCAMRDAFVVGQRSIMSVC